MTLLDTANAQYEALARAYDIYLNSRRDRLHIENYFPMSLAGYCPNKLAFSYLNYKEDKLSERQLRTFWHGIVFENYIRYKLLDNPYGYRWDNYQIELRIADPPQVGHPEGTLWADSIQNVIAYLNGELVEPSRDEADWDNHHLEIKTLAQAIYPKSPYGFSCAMDKGIYVAYPEYIAQEQCYLHELKNCDDTFFIYENKNTDYIHGECVPYMEDEFNKVQDKLKGIYDVIKSGKLPDRAYDNAAAFPCSWEHFKSRCGYFSYCYTLEEVKSESR